jgi:hypothetical protein
MSDVGIAFPQMACCKWISVFHVLQMTVCKSVSFFICFFTENVCFFTGSPYAHHSVCKSIFGRSPATYHRRQRRAQTHAARVEFP